jgi:hypothetical protein
VVDELAAFLTVLDLHLGVGVVGRHVGERIACPCEGLILVSTAGGAHAMGWVLVSFVC